MVEKWIDMLHSELKTTVVGSFPLKPFHDVDYEYAPYFNREKIFSEKEPVVTHPYIPSMAKALEIQVRAGIDYPCYGQLQDMNLMFLGPLARKKCGIKIINNKAYVVEDLKPPKTSIAQDVLLWANRYRRYFEGVKIPLTGPITLASVSSVGDKSVLNYPELIRDLSEIVAKIARDYDKNGAGIITLDEPSLPYATYIGIDSDLIIDCLNKVIKEIKKAIPAIHVCGKLDSTTTEILLETDALLVDHEFASIPENLDAYSKSDLDKYDKIIGLGCVVSNIDPEKLIEISKGQNWNSVVETKEEISDFIKKAANKFGIERLVLDPDCGFGGLKHYIKGELTENVLLKICYQKMKNMVDVARDLRKLT
ncbi:MAG: hypothetical protein ACE5K4_03215 [Candidatus Hydrothermarchaeota archaeon]